MWIIVCFGEYLFRKTLLASEIWINCEEQVVFSLAKIHLKLSQCRKTSVMQGQLAFLERQQQLTNSSNTVSFRFLKLLAV